MGAVMQDQASERSSPNEMARVLSALNALKRGLHRPPTNSRMTRPLYSYRTEYFFPIRGKNSQVHRQCRRRRDIWPRRAARGTSEMIFT
jgi:hypothetical protein